MAGISDDVEDLRVNRSDFMHALEDVQPAFGVSEEELQQVIQNGIIRFHTSVDVRDSSQLASLVAETYCIGTATGWTALCGTGPFVNSYPTG